MNQRRVIDDSTRTLRRWILAAVLVCALPLSMALEYKTVPIHGWDAHISITTADERAQRFLSSYLVECVRLTDDLLWFEGKPSYPIQVILEEPNLPPPKTLPDALRIVLKPDMSEVAMTAQLFRELLHRRLVSYKALELDTHNPFFELTVAGLTHRLAFGRHSMNGFLEPDMRLVRPEFLAHRTPELAVLLTHTVQPDIRYAYELYMAHADLCLQFIASFDNHTLMRELLFAEQRGNSVFTELEKATETARNGKSLQTAYDAFLTKTLQLRIRYAPGKWVMTQVNDLEMVQMLDAGVGLRLIPLSKLTRMEIDSIPQEWLSRRIQGFSRMLNFAPQPFKPALELYADAFSRALNGDKRTLQNDCRAARIALEKAEKRYNAIQKMLDDYEKRTRTPVELFADYLDIFRRYRRYTESLYAR